jgi:PAS domain-containing protein
MSGTHSPPCQGDYFRFQLREREAICAPFEPRPALCNWTGHCSAALVATLHRSVCSRSHWRCSASSPSDGRRRSPHAVSFFGASRDYTIAFFSATQRVSSVACADVEICLLARPWVPPSRGTLGSRSERTWMGTLLAVWKTKAEGAVPDRSMFDAKTLKQFLPNVTIIERKHVGGTVSYQFRLIGTEIVRLFGEGTGERLEDAVQPPFVERWSSAYDAVLKARRPLRVETHFELPQVSYLDGETY